MQSLAAIADPTRRRIVELLAESSRTSGELAHEFDMSAPAISQHLNVLRKAGLVTTRAKGQSRIQSLNPDGFDELDAWLHRTREFWSRNLDSLERELRADDEKSGNVGGPVSRRAVGARETAPPTKQTSARGAAKTQRQKQPSKS